MTAQRAVVAGLGKTGLSVVRYLLRSGWKVAVTDSRAAPPGLDELRQAAPACQVSAGGLDETLLADADVVVASPGLPQADPFFAAARRRGVPVIGDIELFARSGAGPVVGITGTNGKSTVTTLVARMAEKAGRVTRAGGNLAPPALDLLDGAAGRSVCAGALQLPAGDDAFPAPGRRDGAECHAGSPGPLRRYCRLRGGQGAGSSSARQWPSSTSMIAIVAGMATDAARRVTFSLHADAGADYSLQRHDGRGLAGVPRRAGCCVMKELRIVGLHNAANALAALALGEALGLARPAMLAALKEFPGLPHRSEWVADVAGVRYVNDSKGTNVGATLAAVAGFTGPAAAGARRRWQEPGLLAIARGPGWQGAAGAADRARRFRG